MGYEKRSLASMFVQRGKSVEYISAGNAYRNVRKDRMVETAEIRSVYTDGSGIPHIRYDVVIEKPHWPSYRDGPRVLAVQTFFNSFPERVQR